MYLFKMLKMSRKFKMKKVPRKNNANKVDTCRRITDNLKIIKNIKNGNI